MLATAFGDRVAAAWSQASGADVTRAWGRLATPTGSVLVATREAMWWPMAAPGGAVVLGEGRRAMKDRQTPTVHVRDVLRRRGAVERFPVISTGAVPTAETVAAGVEIMAVAGRTWPLAEIVDRTEEPPGSGTVTTRARNALRVAARGGGRGFVLCPHRGNSVRCVRCRSLRQCQVCATSLGRDDVCSRCGASGGPCAQCGANHFEAASTSVGRVITELGSVVGSAVGEAGSARPITVGTERDMPLSGSVDIAVAVDGDAAVFAANYRAAEDALRLLARLATSVRRGRTNRTLVQTSRAGHAVYEALRRGSAADFMAAEVARRRQDGFPPAGELVAVEVRDPVGAIAADLEEAVAGDGVVMGPAPVGERMRWLIQGGDLRRAKVALRPMVQSWRESGARVRIDVDPIDL
jgi:primosomal protein N' (replication factor Y)